MKAELPPSLAMAQATLAGAPPGALMKAGASANDTPDAVGTKSISISPNEITNEAMAASASVSLKLQIFSVSNVGLVFQRVKAAP